MSGMAEQRGGHPVQRMVSAAAVLALVLLGTTAEAQSLAPAGRVFRVEAAPRTLGGGPRVEGYV